MAACNNGGSNSSIRVRLYFDYPPPAVIDSRMCWLLVDLNTCRVVADLESIIKEKFEFSRGNILNLFIEDCYLPHTESIYVVRDNDSVRVKVHCLTQVNGHDNCPKTSRKNCRKRQRPTEEDEPVEGGASMGWKKKKRKQNGDKNEILKECVKAVSDDEPKIQGKHADVEKQCQKKKKSKKKKRGAGVSTKEIVNTVEHTFKSTSKPTAAKATSQNVSSSDSISTFKIPTKNKPLTSSSSKGKTKDNSKLEEARPALQSTNHSLNHAAHTTVPPAAKGGETCSSDSEEEMDLVNHQQTVQPGHDVGSQRSERGNSMGKGRNGASEDKGSCRGREDRRHTETTKFNSDGAKEPSYLTDSLTNTSMVLQNLAESAPKQDYSSMPLLAAPPQVGQKIAFKLLELTDNYTPEVSEYKEAKIVSFDPSTKQIELELLFVSQAPAEPGKFDLVYQNPDGTERVEYAVSRGTWMTERWDSLLEPRLII